MPARARPAHTRGPTCLLHVLLQKPAAGSVHMSQHTCSCWVDDSLHSDCQSRTTTHIPAAWESVLPDTVRYTGICVHTCVCIFVLTNQLESLSSVACIHSSCHSIHYCTIHIHAPCWCAHMCARACLLTETIAAVTLWGVAGRMTPQSGLSVR